MTKEQHIQQHYYTRARQGIFRTNEGLDTVAKSASLDNSFIKKTLHPFCVYLPPHELSQRGEQDYLLYPESLTMFHADSGELVIGRSIMAGADFTGQRDTIFAHHYVVPPVRKEDYLKSGNGIFRVSQFASAFDASQGQELPELTDIPYGQESYLENQDAVLEKLGIDALRFKQLLSAVMTAIASNKKVYVTLDVDVSESAVYGKQLTESLFHLLPYELRRHFGFSTYQNEPQAKKYMDLMFVEKGSIRLGERSLDKAFIFDFAGDRFMNVELVGQDHYFLDLAWACRERPDAMAAFFAFAEEALQGTDQARKMSYAAYNELCALFRMDKGMQEVYTSNKEGVLTSIMGYLKTGELSAKRQLCLLFEKLVRSEMDGIRAGGLVSAEYARVMMEYAAISSKPMRQEIVRDLALVLYNNWNTGQDEAYTVMVMEVLKGQPELFNDVIGRLQSQTKYIRVLEDYILARLGTVSSVEGIIEEITFWSDLAPSVLNEGYFQEQCSIKIGQVLSSDRSQISGGNKLYRCMDKLVVGNSSMQEVADVVKQEVAHTIFGSLESAKLSVEEIDRLDYLIQYVVEAQVRLGAAETRAMRIAGTAALVWNSGNHEREDLEVTLNKLDDDAFDELQQLLRRQLKGRVSRKSYLVVTCAFFKPYFGSGEPDYDYVAMLDYVGRNTGDKEEVFDFLLWLSESVTVDHRFGGGLRQYFREYDPQALRSKRRVKALTSSKSSEFRKLIVDMERKQMTGFKRLLLNRKMLPLLLAAILIGAILIVGIVWIWLDSRDTGAPVEPSPSIPVTEPSETPSFETLEPLSTPSPEGVDSTEAPEGSMGMPEGAEGETSSTTDPSSGVSPTPAPSGLSTAPPAVSPTTPVVSSTASAISPTAGAGEGN